MDRTLGIFSVSTLVLVLITAGMVSSTTGLQASGPDGALDVANAYIMNEPTFKFDGMKETLKVDVTGTFPDPEKYEVTVGFTSAHGGYGDRNGVMVTQALTPHCCVLMVESGQVSSAVMDGSYDMVTQKFLK
jgi:hypothetical protein